MIPIPSATSLHQSNIHLCTPCTHPRGFLALTPEFRAGQCPQVTPLHDTTAINPQHANLLQRSDRTQSPTRGRGSTAGAGQVRRARVTLTGGGHGRGCTTRLTYIPLLLPPACQPKTRSLLQQSHCSEAGWERLVTHYSRANHPTSSCQRRASISLHKTWPELLKEAKGQSWQQPGGTGQWAAPSSHVTVGLSSSGPPSSSLWGR